jgi:D-serine deaminase-like pyridoxal phosphate-dependent protein
MNNVDIKSPTLLLDVSKCRNNIRRMAEKAHKHQLMLRPHFKTHQSADVAQWMRTEGIQSCTVSSIAMARYFAKRGWDDILIAFPVNVREHAAIQNLAREARLQVLCCDRRSLESLEHCINTALGVKIELDLGSRRSGLRPTQRNKIDELLAFLEKSEVFEFTGFYSHPGHTYLARSREDIRSIYARFMPQLHNLRTAYGRQVGFSITIGDTPGCSVVEEFGPINEISPGNFVFFDTMQVNIGSCTYDDIAVVMACPVVGKNTDRKELLIHGGAVNFSKESLQDTDRNMHFGKLAHGAVSGWYGVMRRAFLKSISQEHGLVHAEDDLLKKTDIGDLLYVYPVHSCLAADAMGSYLTVDNVTLSMQPKL